MLAWDDSMAEMTSGTLATPIVVRACSPTSNPYRSAQGAPYPDLQGAARLAPCHLRTACFVTVETLFVPRTGHRARAAYGAKSCSSRHYPATASWRSGKVASADHRSRGATAQRNGGGAARRRTNEAPARRLQSQGNAPAGGIRPSTRRRATGWAARCARRHPGAGRAPAESPRAPIAHADRPGAGGAVAGG